MCEKKGGTVRLLVELDDAKLIPFVKRFNASETRICNRPSKGRMAVQKDKQMIMSDSANAKSNGYKFRIRFFFVYKFI